MNCKVIIVVIYSIVFSTSQSYTSWAAESFESMLQQGIFLYQEGVEGDGEAVDKSIELLKRALHIKNDHPHALVFLGCSYTLKARDGDSPMDKLGYINKGLMYMDKAVKMDPQDQKLRLARVMNNLNLPAFLNRDHVIETDLVFLLDRIDDESLPIQLKQSIMLQAGIYYFDRRGAGEKAKELWISVIEMDGKSKAGKIAKKRLKKMENQLK